MDYIIRKAKREDCLEIANIAQEKICATIDAKRLAYEGFDSKTPAFQCLVAEDAKENRRVIGYLLYGMAYGSWEGKRFWIDDLVVSNNYIGRGVEERLYSALCKEALELNIVAMRLVIKHNDTANNIFKKFGLVNTTESIGWQYCNISEENIAKCANLY